MAQNNKLIEKLDSIDYTHLLGYPPEVVAAEVMSMVKDVVSDYMGEITKHLRECRDHCIFDAEVRAYQAAVRIVKGGTV